MDFISFPLLYFKMEPGNTDPALNQSNAELKQPCLSCNSGNFLFLEEGSWATCEIFPWLFWLSVTIHFVLQYGMWTRFVVILVKSCAAFI